MRRPLMIPLVAAATLTAGVAATAMTGPSSLVASLQTEDDPSESGPRADREGGFPGRHRGRFGPGPRGFHARPGAVLERALDGLVADGTLTQAQGDAVLAAVEAQVDETRGAWQDRREETLQVAADAIGISVDDLRAALQNGSSIAEVAEQNGVTAEAVVDALVTHAEAEIEEAVANGRIDGQRAADIKERLREMLEKLVARERPAREGHVAGTAT